MSLAIVDWPAKSMRVARLGAYFKSSDEAPALTSEYRCAYGARMLRCIALSPDTDQIQYISFFLFDLSADIAQQDPSPPWHAVYPKPHNVTPVSITRPELLEKLRRGQKTWSRLSTRRPAPDRLRGTLLPIITSWHKWSNCGCIRAGTFAAR